MVKIFNKIYFKKSFLLNILMLYDFNIDDNLLISNVWVWKWKQHCYFYETTQDKEIFFPHWSFCILRIFFVIFLHFASRIRIQTNVHNITEANYWNCSFASGPMDKTSPSLIHVKCKCKKEISCEDLAQISLMERKELNPGFFSVCWISHHFFDCLSLSTQNISLNLACTSSAMCSRTYLHPSNFPSLPHT